MKAYRGLATVALLLLVSAAASADPLLGSFTTSEAIGGLQTNPNIPLPNWTFLDILAGPQNGFSCTTCFKASFNPSNVAQSADFTSSDPNFSAIANYFSASVNNWAVSDAPNGMSAGGTSGILFGAPGSNPTLFRITISGFQILDTVCDAGPPFGNVPCELVVGTQGPPTFFDEPDYTVTVEAFGEAAITPEPASLFLIGTGFAAVAAKLRNGVRA